MFGNKYLLCSLQFCGYNVDSIISRQCLRNMIFSSVICKKLKVEDSSCIKADKVKEESVLKTDVCSEIESRQVGQSDETVRYDLKKQIDRGKYISYFSDTNRKTVRNGEEKYVSTKSNHTPNKEIYVGEPKSEYQIYKRNVHYEEKYNVQTGKSNANYNHQIDHYYGYRPWCKDIIKNIDSFSIYGSDNFITEYNENAKYLDTSHVLFILRHTKSIIEKLQTEMTVKKTIAIHGKENFNQHIKDRRELLNQFYSHIKDTLLEKEVQISPNVELLYRSVKPVLNDMEKIKILTRSVKHPVLRYRETAPCIAFYRGALHLIFWRKTNVQTIMSPITHPTMLRLVAAIGAVNASDAFPFMINKGLIVDIYSSGEPATPHVVEQNLLELYWIRWLKRLKLFHMNFNKKMKFFE